MFWLIYSQSKDPKIILNLLSAKFKQHIVLTKTLLFLDEVQKTPEVIGTLRYFYEQMPELAVIATGSLLDFALNSINFGAEINEKNFKAYFLDIGLVASLLDLNILDFNNENFNMINAGKMTEQFVAQELLQLRELYEQPILYYWLREKKSAAAEIDFVIPYKGSVLPVEVKAGKSGTLKSLHYFMSEKKLPIAVRFCDLPPSVTDVNFQVESKQVKFKLLTLPFYLIGQVKRLLMSG